MADGISLLPEEFKKKEEEERKKRGKDKPGFALYVPGAVSRSAPPSVAKPVKQPGFFGRLFRNKSKPLIAKPTAKSAPIATFASVPKPLSMSSAPAVSQPPKSQPLPPAPSRVEGSPKPMPPAKPTVIPPPPPQPKSGPQFSVPTGSDHVLRVSLIPEEGGKPVKKSGSGLRIVVVVAVLSAVAVGVGFGVAQVMAASRAAEITNVEAVITQTDARIREADSSLATARRAGRQLGSMRKLLDGHVQWTRFFDYLEKNTIPTVTFAQLHSESVGTVTLDGLAESFAAAAEQIVVFRTSPGMITAADAGGMTADVSPSGEVRGVRFTMTLTLTPSLLTPGVASSSTVR
ncbi:MAG: hypothetical protein AAB974_03320 [Patescibacteria group bacterium]